jgi:hypothetical protein
MTQLHYFDRILIMPTSTLRWTTLVLAGTQLFASDDSIHLPIIQWHSAGSTLYITIRDKVEMDLRLEREIVDIEVLLFPVQN